MITILDWILKQGAQASTWKGLIAILAAVGVYASPELQAQIVSFGLALFGLIEVIRNEAKK